MDPQLLLPVLGLFIFLAVLGIAYAFLGPPSLAQRLPKEAQEGSPKLRWRNYLQKSEVVLGPLGKFVPRSPAEMSRQERRLVAAGIRRKDGPLLFAGLKLSVAILLVFLFISIGLLKTNPFLYVLLSIFLGALLPDAGLKYLITRRDDRIQLALPNALDLTVVCVEAGMGLDQALMRIGDEMRRGFPELSDELKLLGIEINAGRRRVDALRNLANRTGNKDLKSLVAVLIQTDRFGTSIAQSLRVFSEAMRGNRRMRAEEHAAKMSIKMLPALVFFIFPAMFIIILGPAIIAISRDLIPALGGR